MSEKKLLSIFMEQIATDQQFAAKVAALETEENLMELAKSVGFTLTADQARIALKKVQRIVAEEGVLADEELDGIAGGLGSGGCSIEYSNQKC